MPSPEATSLLCSAQQKQLFAECNSPNPLPPTKRDRGTSKTMPLSKIAAAAIKNSIIAHQCREGAEERFARLRAENSAPTTLVHWHWAEEGKPDPLPEGDHLFALRGAKGTCVASFQTFERSDPDWFERGILAWAKLPAAPVPPSKMKGKEMIDD